MIALSAVLAGVLRRVNGTYRTLSVAGSRRVRRRVDRVAGAGAFARYFGLRAVAFGTIRAFTKLFAAFAGGAGAKPYRCGYRLRRRNRVGWGDDAARAGGHFRLFRRIFRPVDGVAVAQGLRVLQTGLGLFAGILQHGTGLGERSLGRFRRIGLHLFQSAGSSLYHFLNLQECAGHILFRHLGGEF